MIVVKMQQQLQMPRSALFEVTLFKKLHSELGGPTRAAWRGLTDHTWGGSIPHTNTWMVHSKHICKG